MGGDVERIKERLDVAEVVGGYVKLDRAGASFKGRCPFHNEKTPSFFVSPARQSYYCFGCGAKGDIFTFVQEVEGVSFREALKSLAERAGVELENRPVDAKAKDEKETLLQALEVAAEFFEREFSKSEEAKKYVASRGITDASVKKWKLGYAPAEWRGLYSHMMSLGFKADALIKAGLIKIAPDGSGKEPYDVFRDRVIFPLSNAQGEIIAFAGRALQKDAVPKYLNSPDTVLFTKSEVLYGLDKAKEKIRRANFAVLVEGQVDLVLSHQAGVENTVASSGTAFTAQHLERLKRLSKRILLAFDGDEAGFKAAEKASALALALGLEAKVARLPEGKDPAELVSADPQSWKDALKSALPAIEAFLTQVIVEEKDQRKRGLEIRRKILPLIATLESSMERSHFVSLIAQKTGIKEDMIWADLRSALPRQSAGMPGRMPETKDKIELDAQSRREKIEERLTEVRAWLAEKELDKTNAAELQNEEVELANRLKREDLAAELAALQASLVEAEALRDAEKVGEILKDVQKVLVNLRALEEKAR